jgi:uncharacterized protein (TIGR02996 family)
MNPEAAFLRAIAENPDEDLPRLLYADWLEEQGSAEEQARAEFIRLQCALEAMSPADEQAPPMRRREQELFEQIWPDLVMPVRKVFQLLPSNFRSPERPKGNFLTNWLGFSTGSQLVDSLHSGGEARLELVPRESTDEAKRYPHSIASVEFRRGFIDDLTVRASDRPDLEAWGRLSDEFEPRGLTLVEGDWLEVWAELPIIPRLKKLSFIYERPQGTSDAVMSLFNFTDPLCLRELELHQAPFDRELLQQFFDSWLVRQLHTLRWTAQDPDEVLVFAHQQPLTRLHTLDLSHSLCHSLGVCHLASSRAFESLQVLDLSHCSVGDTGLRALARCGHFPNLRQLHLQENRLGEYSVRNLANGTGLGSLKLLNLAGNPKLDESAAYALAESVSLSSLETLIVDERLKPTDAGRALRERFGGGVVFS